MRLQSDYECRRGTFNACNGGADIQQAKTFWWPTVPEEEEVLEEIQNKG
jgi:hypothetical protein